LHERSAPLLPQPQPGDAGEPVVGVDQVVRDAALPRELLDARRELAQMGVDRLARHRSLRARGQVHHAGARPQLHHPGNGRVLRAGEHVDVQPHAAELARDLAHVDVHAPRLLAAESGEGAGVHREHRDREVHRATLTLSTSSGEGPKPYLYGSSPRRKSNTGNPRSMASRITWASNTMPGASAACAGSK